MSVSWVIGRGLLGSSVLSTLIARADATFEAGRFSWTDPSELRQQFSTSIDAFVKQAGDQWAVYWTAGRGIMSSTKEELQAETANLQLFLGLLEQKLPTGSGLLILASSAGSIYAGSQEEVIDESTPPKPTAAYGEEKLRQEEIVNTWSTKTNVPVFIARIANLYGPRQSKGKKQGLITHIARSMILHKPIHIFVPLDTMRDYIHVDDAAAELVQAAEETRRMKKSAMKIIASEESTTVAAIIGIFRRITRRQPLVVTASTPLGATYPHRTAFHSTVFPGSRAPKRTSLFTGVAGVLASERLEMSRNGV